MDRDFKDIGFYLAELDILNGFCKRLLLSAESVIFQRRDKRILDNEMSKQLTVLDIEHEENDVLLNLLVTNETVFKLSLLVLGERNCKMPVKKVMPINL